MQRASHYRRRQPRAFDFDAGARSIDAQAIALQQAFADRLPRVCSPMRRQAADLFKPARMRRVELAVGQIGSAISAIR
jgi:hypothetical protein